MFALQNQKFRDIIKKVIILIFLFAIELFSQDVVWQREYLAVVNGDTLFGAYSGGLNNTGPTFIDIDGDSDFDLFIGDYFGYISFYRNDGTVNSPTWIRATAYYNSISVEFGSAPTFIDIDGDSDFDMFIGEGGGRIRYYRNDGTQNSPSWTLVSAFYDSIDVEDCASPAFVDIDGDVDFDLFIGDSDGNIHFYRNDGTANSPSWTLVSENYDSIDVGVAAEPAFVDIDGDSDFDLFIGEYDGNVNFYRNDGTENLPSWTLVSENYDSIAVASYSSPAFVDIDGDSDFDLFIGDERGNLNVYRNDGTANSPSWTFVTMNCVSIDVGKDSKSTFVDIDGDSDFDMFIGCLYGNVNFYRNDGTGNSPSWTLVTESYDSINVGSFSSPSFVDIDGDLDFDMFVGKSDGNIDFYRNDGTANSPSWTFVTGSYDSIDVGSRSSPAFVDIDGDLDFDMFVGEHGGNVNFYRNDGTQNSPSWTFVAESYDSINVGNDAKPTFVDIDGDSDFDMFIGEWGTYIHFYRNDGTVNSPSWTFVTDRYNYSDYQSAPAFADIDGDSDFDMFVCDYNGGLRFWRNMGLDGIVEEVQDENIVCLLGAYPSVFNYYVTIKYYLSSKQRISLELYDISGRHVITFVSEEKPSGNHSFTWYGRNSYGNPVSNGIYFCVLKTNGVSETIKLMLVR